MSPNLCKIGPCSLEGMCYTLSGSFVLQGSECRIGFVDASSLYDCCAFSGGKEEGGSEQPGFKDFYGLQGTMQMLHSYQAT